MTSTDANRMAAPERAFRIRVSEGIHIESKH